MYATVLCELRDTVRFLWICCCLFYLFWAKYKKQTADAKEK